MNEIAKQPADPDDPLPDRPEVGLSAVQVMAHELGHYWLAHASYDRGDGIGQHCNLRAMVATEGGAGNCDGYAVSDFGLHWSPFLDSGAVMFGNQIEDRGDGTFRFFNDGNAHFGRLDQYLMGLRPAEQVGEILLVRHDGFSGIGTADYPLPIGTEKIVTGWRVDVDIQDVIRFEGERFPVADPCHWKGAAVIVYATGKPPSQADVARVAAHATRFETYYAEATEGLGSIDLTIDGRGAGTATCPAPSCSVASRSSCWSRASCPACSRATWARCNARCSRRAWACSACCSSRWRPASSASSASRRSPRRASRSSRCSAPPRCSRPRAGWTQARARAC